MTPNMTSFAAAYQEGANWLALNPYNCAQIMLDLDTGDCWCRRLDSTSWVPGSPDIRDITPIINRVRYNNNKDEFFDVMQAEMQQLLDRGYATA